MSIGFEKPDFECELFGTVSGPFEKDDFVVGVIKKGMFNNCPHMWSVKHGTCYTSSLASNMKEYDLVPIKKEWYRYRENFPCLLTNGKDFVFLTERDYEEWDGSYICGGYRPATKEEAISLIVEVN